MGDPLVRRGWQRHQRNGLRTRGESRAALDKKLRQVRQGPLYRPHATLDELVAAYLEQYDAAESSAEWLRYNVGFAQKRFGSTEIGSISAQQVGAWRKALPEGRRYPAHRALRQVIEAELHPLSGALVVFLVGTGVRPEEGFGGEWADVDLTAGIFTVRRAYAKGRLKDYTKTHGSRRAVPLRDRVIEALEPFYRRRGIMFPSPGGGRMDINNWRNRSWTPALAAAGVTHRRIYDLRHTYASWSLAAGVDIFTLARRMGTSVKMIDRTYGHLVAGADDRERELLNAFDGANGRCVGAAPREDGPECA